MPGAGHQSRLGFQRDLDSDLSAWLRPIHQVRHLCSDVQHLLRLKTGAQSTIVYILTEPDSKKFDFSNIKGSVNYLMTSSLILKTLMLCRTQQKPWVAIWNEFFDLRWKPMQLTSHDCRNVREFRKSELAIDLAVSSWFVTIIWILWSRGTRQDDVAVVNPSDSKGVN